MHLLVVGSTRDARIRVADRTDAVLRVDDVERAFPDRQAGGIRLVLTQSTFVVEALLESLGADQRVVFTADASLLKRCAPEAFERRGPWKQFELEQLAVDGGSLGGHPPKTNRSAAAFGLGIPPMFIPSADVREQLSAAYWQDDPRFRMAMCRAAADAAGRSPVAWLSVASAARENGDAKAARAALDRALAMAPDWAATQYEDGKFWLASDDLARARDAFTRAGELMPQYAPAFSNLGAVLGELDEPEPALAALQRALASDREAFTILNNIGVVLRELGRLDESAAAFREVVQRAPSFVFGYYNLGHTLLLAGDYRGALAAYEEGRRRDPEASPRQAARLAIVRLANHDAGRAESELWAAVAMAPQDEREDILLEAYEIGHALILADSRLEPHKPFLARIAAAVTSSP